MTSPPAPSPRCASVPNGGSGSSSTGAGVGTGSWSRETGRALCHQLLQQARQQHRTLTVVWIDIDRFRQINDTFGHACGDQIIESLAQRIQSAVPPSCPCVRMGSDEFVLLHTALSHTGAEQLARSILAEVSKPLALQGIDIRPTVSLGLHRAHAGETASEVLEQADRAMIDAKRHGGNRWVWSGHETLPGALGIEHSRRELAVASHLHEALDRGGFWLRYQPILRPDGSLEAVEALMSCGMGHPPLSPGEFIPVAEKIGLIDKLGEWCLMEGALCAARLHRRGWPTKVAINVSRAQLLSEGFLNALQGALVCANVAPQWIELELTESLFMEQTPIVQDNLRRIRDTGVGLAIDDFGTGYSCLASLKDLPATKLKFDRAFIQSLPDDPRALAIVRSMTDLAHHLGLVVVAEGVETPEQLAACEDAGLDSTQGYHHALPMPEDQLLAWMEAHNHEC
ncbi:putative bifunctional diguanylate cyclase/phosphodiesterase [Hydrogenophaga soli]